MTAVRCALAVLLFCGLAFAQVELIPQRNTAALIEMKGLVARYCQMDSDGFRLDAGRASRMTDVTTWQTIPEVTRFDVVRPPAITAPKSNPDGTVRVKITYTILGTYIMGAGFTADAHTDTIELRLIHQNDGWRISASDEMATPRLQRAPAYRWLREHLAAEKNSENRALLEDAARQLQP